VDIQFNWSESHVVQDFTLVGRCNQPRPCCPQLSELTDAWATC